MAIKCFYSIVRHVPDPVRTEAVNIALILAGPDYLSLRVASDTKHIRKLNPNFDDRFIEGMRREWPDWLKAEMAQARQPADVFLAALADKIGGWQTQLTEPRLVEVQAEVKDFYRIDQVCNDLFVRLVKAPQYPSRSIVTGRSWKE